MGTLAQAIPIQSDSHLANMEIGELVYLLRLSEGSVNHAQEELRQRTFEEITEYFALLVKEEQEDERKALYKFMVTEDRFEEFLADTNNNAVNAELVSDDDPLFHRGKD